MAVLPVSTEELDVIAAFVANVIHASVGASAEEKAHFIERTQKNRRKFSEAPGNRRTRLRGQFARRQLVEAAISACRKKSPRGALVLNSSRNAIGFCRRYAPVNPDVRPQ